MKHDIAKVHSQLQQFPEPLNFRANYKIFQLWQISGEQGQKFLKVQGSFEF